MDNNTNLNTVNEAPVMETVESLLADLDLEEIVQESAPVEETVEEETVSEEEAAALDTQIAKSEAYEGQAGDGGTIELGEPAKTGKKAKAAKAPKEPKAPKAPAAPRDLSSLPDSAFVLTVTPPADLVANRADVMAKRPTQKKIADKFDNLLLSVAAGKAPSEYTMHCFKALLAKGTVTQGDLVSMLTSTNSNKGSGYTIGTARSQAGQFMVLANALGIATRTGNTLVMNQDSSLAQALAAF